MLYLPSQSRVGAHTDDAGFLFCSYWAIAIPTFIIVTGIFIVLVYIAVNLMNTAPPQSLDLITDKVAVYETVPSVVPHDSIPAISDIPIEVANEVMYRRHM